MRAREALETFEPERLASRILGMGDVLSLIEKAQETFDQRQAEEAGARLLKGEFGLDDFADQLAQVRKMGPLAQVLEMIPGGWHAVWMERPPRNRWCGRKPSCRR